MLSRVIVQLSALAMGVHVGVTQGVAQSALLGPDERFCRDLNRLVESADDGFRPFVVRRMPGMSGVTEVIYDAVPIAGFESAFIRQTGRRIDGGKPTSAVYHASSPSLSIAPYNPTVMWVHSAAQCLGQQPVVFDPNRGARFHFGEIEISILYVETRYVAPENAPLRPSTMRGPRVTFQVRSPPQCPKDSRELTSC